MKTSISVLSALGVSVLGLCVTLNAPRALAADTKTYPGYMCKQYAGTGTVVEFYGSIVNNQPGPPTHWVYLGCPVVKNLYKAVSSGWVRATDRHLNEDIICQLVGVYRTDNDSAVVYFTSGPQYTSGPSPSDINKVQTLNFGFVHNASFGHYYYSCAIPPGHNGYVSEIHTYSVTE